MLATTSEQDKDRADTQPLVGPLLAKGLISDQLVNHDPSRELPAPACSLNAEDCIPAGKVGLLRTSRFMAASARTAAALRCRTLDSIAQALTQRGGKYPNGRATCGPDRLREPVSAYERLRPLVFTAKQNCLHDSLTLLDFLAREDIFPTWVIGVRIRPFAAHSWVQEGRTVLNDQHDHVRQFCPILIV